VQGVTQASGDPDRPLLNRYNQKHCKSNTIYNVFLLLQLFKINSNSLSLPNGEWPNGGQISTPVSAMNDTRG
jgi:hypothetical protein